MSHNCDELEVTRQSLATFFSKIIEKLELHQIETVKIDVDYYLIIDTDEWENFGQEVKPNVGSLCDDMASLKRAVTEDSFTFVDFERVASILRAISQKLCPAGQTS